MAKQKETEEERFENSLQELIACSSTFDLLHRAIASLLGLRIGYVVDQAIEDGVENGTGRLSVVIQAAIDEHVKQCHSNGK